MSSGADLNRSTPAVPFSPRLEIVLSKQSRYSIVDAGLLWAWCKRWPVEEPLDDPTPRVDVSWASRPSQDEMQNGSVYRSCSGGS